MAHFATSSGDVRINEGHLRVNTALTDTKQSPMTGDDVHCGWASVVLSSPMGLLVVAILISAALPAAAQDSRQENVASLAVPAPQIRQALETVDIDSLTLESDFKVFMTRECAEEIRLKALRRLWSLMPPAALDDNPAI